MELDRVPLWRGDHVEVRQLVDDFARYLYLPRLREPAVLLGAVNAGVGLLTWENESFAYADSYDEDAKRYRGLLGGQVVSFTDVDAAGMLVKPDVARRQLDAEQTTAAVTPVPTGAKGSVIPDRRRNPKRSPNPRPRCGPGASTGAFHSTRPVPGATRAGSPTR